MRKLTSVAVVAFLVGLVVAGPVAQTSFWGTGNDNPANFGADGKSFLTIFPTGGIFLNSAYLSLTPVGVTGSAVTITAATHGNRTIFLNRAGGIAVTLPAASGSGVCYSFVVGATFTGDATIKVASTADYFVGTAVLLADGGATVVGFATDNTATLATESDTLDLFDTGNVTGGIVGAYAQFCDVSSIRWVVYYLSDAAGTEATPFKVTVS